MAEPTPFDVITTYLTDTWSKDGLDQVVIFSMAYFIFGSTLSPAKAGCETFIALGLMCGVCSSLGN
jgi:hypothetical protein